VVVDFRPHAARRGQRLRLAGWAPLARLPYVALLVHVVGIAHQGQSQPIGETEEEAAP
jgi:hypothetical protein